MSTNTLPAPRPLDPVIEDRLSEVQNSLFQVTGMLETLRSVLWAHHNESLGGDITGMTLFNAVGLALDGLNDVADRIEAANLCNGSRRRVVRTESFEEVPDAA